MKKNIVQCEYSGTVRDAFIKRGHDTISCDILETDKPGPHFKGDIFEMLAASENGFGICVSHPPCTYMSNSGVRWLFNKDGSKNIPRWLELRKAMLFFNDLRGRDYEKSAFENPIPHKYARDGFDDIKDENGKILVPATKGIGMYDQVVQPYMFGHLEKKATYLWLNGLPKLEATNNVYDEMMKLDYKDRAKIHYCSPGPERQKIRSKTFQGIADAMAEQWGGL